MTAPLPQHLLPDTAVVGADGGLSIGGRDLVGLAAEFGTPLFVYDEAHLRARCREAVGAFGPGVHYATKAFLCTAMARLAHDEGMHLDTATGGEYHVARAAGVPPGAIVLHGNNKSAAELRRAAIYNSHRALLDMTAAGGYGVFYGPNVAPDGTVAGEGRIGGTEVLAFSDDGDGTRNGVLMVQIPSTFDPRKACIVTATSTK